MPIMFNTILKEAGLSPKDIRLLRHKDKRAKRGGTPYELWRDYRSEFELYQSTQGIRHRNQLMAPYWAVFVVNLMDETMFAGIYAVEFKGLLDQDIHLPHYGVTEIKGSKDIFDLTLQEPLSDLIGKLFINWGKGALAWVQYADRQNKSVVELRREFKEPDFPGLLNFIQPLSKLNNIPLTWISVLKSSRGVYLLTCPKTKEQYVGSATGEDGFWGRWLSYIHTGHGGNQGLISRDPSDYQVSILEVAGSSATHEEIILMEGRWQAKLQSKEMGLNRNVARAVH